MKLFQETMVTNYIKSGTFVRRNSSFELMRIIAMFMIVLEHCMLSTSKDSLPPLGVMACIGWGITAFTICAVNLFFLLTGYFISSSTFKIQRIFRLWGLTVFYSVSIFIIMSIIENKGISIRDFLGYLFPVATKKYWFIQTYIVLALFFPFFAILLKNISQKQLNYLLIVCLVFFCLHETFIKVNMTLDQTQGYGIIWAGVMLIVGHWLRINEKLLSNVSTTYLFLIYLFISSMIFLSNYLIVDLNIAGGLRSRGNFYAYNSMTVFFQSVSLFCIFIKLSKKLTYSTKINFCSKNVLSVYLISSHPMLLSSVWIYLFGKIDCLNAPLLYVLFSLLASFLILVFCIVFDRFVIYLLGFILSALSNLKNIMLSRF